MCNKTTFWFLQSAFRRKAEEKQHPIESGVIKQLIENNVNEFIAIYFFTKCGQFCITLGF